jgi:hypothetical protein
MRTFTNLFSIFKSSKRRTTSGRKTSGRTRKRTMKQRTRTMKQRKGSKRNYYMKGGG